MDYMDDTIDAVIRMFLMFLNNNVLILIFTLNVDLFVVFVHGAMLYVMFHMYLMLLGSIYFQF